MDAALLRQIRMTSHPIWHWQTFRVEGAGLAAEGVAAQRPARRILCILDRGHRAVAHRLDTSPCHVILTSPTAPAIRSSETADNRSAG